MSMRCIIHCKDTGTEQVKPCTTISYSRIIDCATQWLHLDGTQQHVASQVDLNANLSDEFGYHQSCYDTFTNKKNIHQANVRVAKGVKRPWQEIGSQASNQNILPNLCLICKKKQIRIKDFRGHKWVPETLVHKNTIPERVILALEHHGIDNSEFEHILAEIKEKGPKSLSCSYHMSCYKEFTRILYIKEKEKTYQYLEQTFEIFCRDIVEKRIIGEGEMFRMPELRDLFVATAKDVENAVLDNYQTYRIKLRLKNKYPNLNFVRESIRNSEIVCVNINDGIGFMNLTENDFTYIDNDLNKTNLFDSAKALRKDIFKFFSNKSCLPIITENVCHENVSDPATLPRVPPSLFHFIAWCTSQSHTDITGASVSEDVKIKIKSICQEIVLLASEDEKRNPTQVPSCKMDEGVNEDGNICGNDISVPPDDVDLTLEENAQTLPKTVSDNFVSGNQIFHDNIEPTPSNDVVNTTDSVDESLIILTTNKSDAVKPHVQQTISKDMAVGESEPLFNMHALVINYVIINSFRGHSHPYISWRQICKCLTPPTY